MVDDRESNRRSGSVVIAGRPAPRRSGPGRARQAQPRPSADDDVPSSTQRPADSGGCRSQTVGAGSRRTRPWIEPRPTHCAGIWWLPASFSRRIRRRRWRTQSGAGPSGPDRCGPRGRGDFRPIRLATGLQALSEFRAARRMGSKSQLLPLIADCERGGGSAGKGNRTGAGPRAAQLTGDDADELRIVAAGARPRSRPVRTSPELAVEPQPDPKKRPVRPLLVSATRTPKYCWRWTAPMRRCSGSCTRLRRTWKV